MRRRFEARAWCWSFLAALAVLCASPGWAEPVHIGLPTEGYSYFNRVGATSTDQQRDLTACADAASRLELVGSGGDHGILPLILNEGPSLAVFISGVENCMLVRGWRVVRVPESEGLTLSELPAEELRTQLASRIGAQEPPGEVVRVWANDAADADNDRYSLRPRATHNGALSLRAFADAIARGQGQGEALPRERIRTLYHDISPNQFASVSPDMAIVIFRVRGVSMRNGFDMGWSRIGDPADNLAPAVGRSPNALGVVVAALAAREDGNWRAYAVPTGRWRMESLGYLSFCLGSPAFEARAGDIIYAGTFDYSARRLGPDLDLEPVRAWLSETSFGERVRAAEYSNGWVSRCDRGKNEIYAVEVEGAPFREGYEWGSAAPH